MPKHHTDYAELQELYDVVRDIDGVRPIDGRSSEISYVANIGVLREIVDQLNRTYGPPTQEHPLLEDIEWRVRPNFRIIVDKAADIDGEGTLHHLIALTF